MGWLRFNSLGFGVFKNAYRPYINYNWSTEVHNDYVLGAELVTNGGFDTDSDWLKGTGWAISGNQAIADGSNTSNSTLYQWNIGEEIGHNYIQTVDIEITSGTFDLNHSGSSTPYLVTKSGVYSYVVNAGRTDRGATVMAKANAIGKINSIQLKKVINKPQTRYLSDVGTSNTDAELHFGRGVSFNGVDQIIKTSCPALGDSGSLLVTATINGLGTDMITAQRGGNRLYIYNRGDIGVGDSTNISTGVSLSEGNTYTIGLVWSNGNWKMYLDGNLVSSGTYDGVVSAQNRDIGGASWYGSNYYSNSVIYNLVTINQILTPTQIEFQYKHPESFLYREPTGLSSSILTQAEIDNVVLYMPMCETDEYVRDLANYSEINIATSAMTLQGGTQTNTPIENGTNVVYVSGNNANNFSIDVSHNAAPYTVEFIANINSSDGDIIINAIYDGSNKIHFPPHTIVNGLNKLTVPSTRLDTTKAFLYRDRTDDRGFDIDFTFAKVFDGTEDTYHIDNFTDACRDDAVQMTKGLQTCFWERDELGVPYDASFDRLMCDGVGYADTGWAPDTNSYLLECIMLTNSTKTYNTFGSYKSETDRIIIGENKNDNRVRCIVNGSSLYSNSYYNINAYRHILIRKINDTFELIVDGISSNTITESIVNDIGSFRLGNVNRGSFQQITPLKLFKLHSDITIDTNKLYVNSYPLLYQKTRKNLVMLVGDSTVTDDKGWGGAISNYLKAQYNVVNKAESGKSSKSYIVEGWWERAKRVGAEYVLIQFGHNDSEQDSRYTDPQTTFKDYLRTYINEARLLGITPYFVTPMLRANFDGNDKVILPDTRLYADPMIDVATEMNVPCILLNRKSEVKYNELGHDGLVPLQPSGDTTHWNSDGAIMLSELIHEEMVRLNLPIAL